MSAVSEAQALIRPHGMPLPAAAVATRATLAWALASNVVCPMHLSPFDIPATDGIAWAGRPRTPEVPAGLFLLRRTVHRCRPIAGPGWTDGSFEE